MGITKWVVGTAITLGLISLPLRAQDAPPPSQTLEQINVRDRASRDDTRPKLEHIMKEVDGEMITVTKKTSITKLDNIPTVIDNNLRDLFAQTPGLYLSEQQTGSQFNLSYRGIGNPQESEFVSVMQDGIPLEGDWIGFPTLYVLPLPQTISQVQLIRGGSSLLYGPEPGPVVNFISRKPDPNREFEGYSENVIGKNGLSGTFNRIDGTVGDWDYLVDAHYRTDDSQRDNAGSILKGADAHVGWHSSDISYWALDFHGYEFAGGDPGRYGYPIFVRDEDFTPTPYNKDFVNRYVLEASNKTSLSSNMQWETKVWRGYQDQVTRAAGAIADVATPSFPSLTIVQDAAFRFTGVDSRIVDHWGRGNALTAGFVYYTSDAPVRQWNNANIYVDPNDEASRFDVVCAKTTSINCIKANQARSTDYGALFAENVFRFEGGWHLVPSVRFERESVDIDESVHVRNAPQNVIPLVDRSVDHTVPLLGLGLGNDFGSGNESYFNVSQGWRPVRYFDIESPTGSLAPDGGNDPTPTHVLTYELGVHGTPLPGLFYDASVFQVNVKDRIESQVIPGDPLNETIDVNTGDTRHRGFEGEIDYDFLAARDPHTSQHLSVFLNLQLLNAEFTATSNPAVKVGNRPAFSPNYLARAGVVYREDKKLKLALSVNSVASQYWQDSDQPANAPTGSNPPADNFIPAKTPQYTVWDFSGDYWVLPQVRLLGGVSNIDDKKYYNRVFGNGIEPALGRTYYAGFSYEF
ncbi:MAG TPA: TonB-dependent receptor [Rudaea sp.]|nr:TonB-dependent receptor [Rudaea sp.]